MEKAIVRAYEHLEYLGCNNLQNRHADEISLVHSEISHMIEAQKAQVEAVKMTAEAEMERIRLEREKALA